MKEGLYLAVEQEERQAGKSGNQVLDPLGLETS